MNKKRILVISSKPPFPVQNGAAIRTMQMLRMLSVFYDIDLIYTYTGINCVKIYMRFGHLC